MLYGLTMKPKAKVQFTAALRSGNYQQSKHALKNYHGYCCLGVKAQIHNIPVDGSDEMWAYDFGPEYGTYETNLPIDWFSQFFDYDWEQSDGRTKEDAVHRVMNSLMSLNDEESKSFKQIADWIDENL